MPAPGILWLTRDFRLRDSPALLAAIADGPLLAVFFVDRLTMAQGAASSWRLSEHLAVGEISPRTIWARAALRAEISPEHGAGIASFLSEVIWREFSWHLLIDFPGLPTACWRAEWERFPWRKDSPGLIRWQRAKTGVALVDAGLRQMWLTGRMHMGQVRHGSATTTHAVRAAIQRSQASLAQLSKELGINPKTVAEWRKRATVEDLKTGPKEPRSTVLTEAEEAMIVAFRHHTLLPLDDCLYV